MKKQERINKIIGILEELYPEPPIPLDHQDPYTLLIAVLLSAQCTDKRVNIVTPGLFALADTPQKMSQLEVSEILGAIKSCGLAPSKAKNILKLSEILVEKHNSIVPQTFEELEELPGVGHKTASVVLSHAFQIPTAPIDTHIHRLMHRWKLSKGSNVVQTEKDFKKCFPESKWEKLHLQIIYFGREYCPARQHDAKKCPICQWVTSPKKI
ncbi:MAG: endonuclease III [Planctomycetes bacterium]|nr:endonuclease III [Planctomycetota bacterium]